MNSLYFKYKVLGANKRPLQISNIDLLSSCHTSFFVTFIQSILKDGGSITLIDPSPQGFPLILPLSLSYPATGCSGKNAFFCKNFHYFATSPSRKHWAAIGCQEIGRIGQPMGMIVHSLCVESFENLLQR